MALRELAIAEEVQGSDPEPRYRAALAMAETVGQAREIPLRGWQVPLAAFLVGANRCREAVPLLRSALAGMDAAANTADPIATPQMLLLLDACSAQASQSASGMSRVDACAALRELPGAGVDVYPVTRTLLTTRCGMRKG
mgnify:FL=1